MGQNPKCLTEVRCDVCQKLIEPKERFVRLNTMTLWSQSGVGLGVFICKKCMMEKFGVSEEPFNG